ncbi:MAG: DUF4845 domain-containing protein [Gammaproteobacteria bacterium]|nr:DUF4845 domain-containing protein [Gammaproteobacteria bacterium]MDH5652608.1 DUF4845 domain-containing protein [Gammaproteobacteria bacterium]
MIINRQKGMTMIGWVLTIAVIGFFVVVFMKLVPVYVQRLNVIAVMSSLKDDASIQTMGPDEVTQTILKRLDVNMAGGIGKENIYITTNNNLRVIELEYEVRRNLFGNHDIIISYLSRIEVPSQ